MRNRWRRRPRNCSKSPSISKAKKALVNIVGGDDLTLREAEKIFQEVSGRISEDAMMKWGARIDQSMQKSAIKIMVVMGGVEFADHEVVDA